MQVTTFDATRGYEGEGPSSFVVKDIINVQYRIPEDVDSSVAPRPELYLQVLWDQKDSEGGDWMTYEPYISGNWKDMDIVKVFMDSPSIKKKLQTQRANVMAEYNKTVELQASIVRQIEVTISPCFAKHVSSPIMPLILRLWLSTARSRHIVFRRLQILLAKRILFQPSPRSRTLLQLKELFAGITA